MMSLTTFAQRSEKTELMDDPHCDPVQLNRTLKQFTHINRYLTHSRQYIQKYIITRMENNPRRIYHILEIGSGGGDIARWILDRCTEKNLSVHITCCDKDPHAAAFLREKFRHSPRVSVIEEDIRDIRRLRFDFVFANHFLHHLRQEDISPLLRHLSGICTEGLLINDLYRSKIAYVFFAVLSTLFLRRSFARFDGLRSIRRSFIPGDFLHDKSFPGDNVAILRGMPFRILFVSRNLLHGNG
ncbi:MAG: methyltransferase [Fibrobacterota bacterium]